MKLFAPLIAACMALVLAACGAITTPYNTLDFGVKTADGGAVVATQAVQAGVPASPYGYDALDGLKIVVAAEPPAEAAAVLTAAPVLAAGAITKATLDGDYTQLCNDVVALGVACTNQAVEKIQVQLKAVRAEKKK